MDIPDSVVASMTVLEGLVRDKDLKFHVFSFLRAYWRASQLGDSMRLTQQEMLIQEALTTSTSSAARKYVCYFCLSELLAAICIPSAFSGGGDGFGVALLNNNRISLARADDVLRAIIGSTSSNNDEHVGEENVVASLFVPLRHHLKTAAATLFAVVDSLRLTIGLKNQHCKVVSLRPSDLHGSVSIFHVATQHSSGSYQYDVERLKGALGQCSEEPFYVMSVLGDPRCRRLFIQTVLKSYGCGIPTHLENVAPIGVWAYVVRRAEQGMLVILEPQQLTSLVASCVQVSSMVRWAVRDTVSTSDVGRLLHYIGGWADNNFVSSEEHSFAKQMAVSGTCPTFVALSSSNSADEASDPLSSRFPIVAANSDLHRFHSFIESKARFGELLSQYFSVWMQQRVAVAEAAHAEFLWRESLRCCEEKIRTSIEKISLIPSLGSTISLRQFVESTPLPTLSTDENAALRFLDLLASLPLAAAPHVMTLLEAQCAGSVDPAWRVECIRGCQSRPQLATMARETQSCGISQLVKEFARAIAAA